MTDNIKPYLNNSVSKLMGITLIHSGLSPFQIHPVTIGSCICIFCSLRILVLDITGEDNVIQDTLMQNYCGGSKVKLLPVRQYLCLSNALIIPIMTKGNYFIIYKIVIWSMNQSEKHWRPVSWWTVDALFYSMWGTSCTTAVSNIGQV